jgi:hypothetical protein
MRLAIVILTCSMALVVYWYPVFVIVQTFEPLSVTLQTAQDVP